MAYSADKKPGELTALTSLATDDVFVVGDTSDASEVAKYITKANLITDFGATFEPLKGADDNYVTDAEKVKLSNLSGTNTGDQDLSTLAPKASPTFTGTVTLPVGLTGVIRTDTGVVSVDTDVTDIVSAASTSAAGKVELAITSEINTGTDSTRAMPVDQYVASNRNVRYVVLRAIAPTTDWSANGTTNVSGDFPMPFAGTLVSIKGDVDTAGTTGTATVDVNLNGSTIMTTNKLNWDSTEKSTSTYSGTAAGLTTTAVSAGDLITIDIDTNHTTKSKGLTVTLGIRMT